MGMDVIVHIGFIMNDDGVLVQNNAVTVERFDGDMIDESLLLTVAQVGRLAKLMDDVDTIVDDDEEDENPLTVMEAAGKLKKEV